MRATMWKAMLVALPLTLGGGVARAQSQSAPPGGSATDNHASSVGDHSGMSRQSGGTTTGATGVSTMSNEATDPNSVPPSYDRSSAQAPRHDSGNGMTNNVPAGADQVVPKGGSRDR